MKEYRVLWEIDIDADSAEQAAARALAIHRDPSSIATIFGVIRYCRECNEYHDDEITAIDAQQESHHVQH